MLRTHTCGELSEKNVGEEVTLCGWVASRRDHGGVIFIDLRDRFGVTQIVFRPEIQPDTYVIGERVRGESVLCIHGTVSLRPSEMVNEKISTGMIEVDGAQAEVLAQSKTPPFEIETEEEREKEIGEEKRMRYRYLDLRRPRMRRNIAVRHAFIYALRSYLHEQQFLEVETPLLTKSTPEGARDYLVPSRVHQGMFYSLPQSPQQYKQLLMIGGIDRYFQIARCLRDEDMRGDRQAEFTQLDIEMSFVEKDDILNLVEEMLTRCIEELCERGDVKKRLAWKSFPRISYADALLRYGSDKPDVRFDLQIIDISDGVKECGFAVFTDALTQENGAVRAIRAPGAMSKLSRSGIDELTEYVRGYGAQGLAYIRVKEDGNGGEIVLDSPIIKYLGDEYATLLAKRLGAQMGDILFFGAGERSIVEQSLGALRCELARRLELIDHELIAPVFIVDFPLFEPTLENGHYAPMHHMFTMPRAQDLSLLDSNPAAVRSLQYDTVINGYEVGGGSIRIHDKNIQEHIFQLIGFSEERREQFTHMLTAFEYGAPPHGGIALGIDRLLMLMLGEPSIREVIAFPKTGDARDLTVGAPSEVEPGQLKELGIRAPKTAHS